MRKKLISLTLALVMVLSMGVVAYGINEDCCGGGTGGGTNPTSITICLRQDCEDPGEVPDPMRATLCSETETN